MKSKPIIVLTLFAFFQCTLADCQPRFSFSIDAGLMRGLKKEYRYLAMGQTLTSHFHLSPKNGLYVFFNYHINGRFENDLNAAAKSSATTPQVIPYENRAKLIITHLSGGWKRYLTGYFDRDSKGNLYGYGGLGLMMGKIENIGTVNIDTANYTFLVQPGKGRFKRLTIDLGMGYEKSIGADLFLYMEARSLIPITNYPTPYLLDNGYAPLNIAAYIGIRMLFD